MKSAFHAMWIALFLMDELDLRKGGNKKSHPSLEEG